MALTVLLAAGGTGGHIIPAIAFGRWLQRQGHSVIWMTGSRPLEREITEAHGISALTLPLEGSPLGVSGIKSLKRWKDLWTSLRACLPVLKKEQVDRCVIFGGYLSLPVLMAAKIRAIPLVIHEQNTSAGKITRLASFLGVPVASAWQKCDGIPEEKRHWTGMPLRDFRPLRREEAQKELLGEPLAEGEKLAIVLGGSLGSKGLAKTLQSLLPVVEFNNWKMLFMGADPKELPFSNAVFHSPCWDMSAVYCAADLIICRAGAATLAELEFFPVPVVVIPWKESAGGHQMRNAQYAVKRGTAVLWTEESSPEDLLAAFFSATVPKKPLEDNRGSSERLWAMLQRTAVALKGEKRFGSQGSGS